MINKELHQMLVKDGWLSPEEAKELQQAKDELIEQQEMLIQVVLSVARHWARTRENLKLLGQPNWWEIT